MGIGTGTPTGDPVEMKAIGRAFREFRSAEEPLYVYVSNHPAIQIAYLTSAIVVPSRRTSDISKELAP